MNQTQGEITQPLQGTGMHQIWAHGIQDYTQKPMQNSGHGQQPVSEARQSTHGNSLADAQERKDLAKEHALVPPSSEKFKLKYERAPSDSDRSSVCETANLELRPRGKATPITDRNLLQNHQDLSEATGTTA